MIRTINPINDLNSLKIKFEKIAFLGPQVFFLIMGKYLRLNATHPHHHLYQVSLKKKKKFLY